MPLPVFLKAASSFHIFLVGSYKSTEGQYSAFNAPIWKAPKGWKLFVLHVDHKA